MADELTVRRQDPTTHKCTCILVHKLEDGREIRDACEAKVYDDPDNPFCEFCEASRHPEHPNHVRRL